MNGRHPNYRIHHPYPKSSEYQYMIELEAISRTTSVLCSGSAKDTAVNEALLARSDVLIMTQQAEDAVLKPSDCGSWSHSLRAAFAARMATLSDQPELAQHYAQRISDNSVNVIADPSNNGATLNLAHVLAFMDDVTVQPKDISASHIQRLQDAAVSDADIVKLTELIAFMAYQMRLVAGIRLLSGVVA